MNERRARLIERVALVWSRHLVWPLTVSVSAVAFGVDWTLVRRMPSSPGRAVIAVALAMPFLGIVARRVLVELWARGVVQRLSSRDTGNDRSGDLPATQMFRVSLGFVAFQMTVSSDGRWLTLNTQGEPKGISQNTIFGKFVDDRRNAQYTASLMVTVSALAYLTFALLTGITVSISVGVIFVLSMAMINGAALALSYRLAHGIYGTNEYEAREILHFILAHSDDTDVSGGLGANDLDLSTEQQESLAGLWEGVRA